MKKISFDKNSKEDSLSEDSETEYLEQRFKDFKDARSLVANNDNLRYYLQVEKDLVDRYLNNDSDSDCSQKIQCNRKSKKVCKYCRKDKHSLNDCPLFKNAIDQQSSMISTYNKSSRNQSHQMDHCSHYDESARQHELPQKAQNDYFRKYCNTDTDQEHFEIFQKAQKEYYSKHCKYCKEYGHLEDKCTILEVPHKESEGNWRDIESKKSKKKKALKTVHDLPEIDHSVSNCVEDTTENCFFKYCHFCKENGHTENICPLVQKAIRRQKGKNIKVLPKIHKKYNFTSATTKVNKGFKKLKLCNFCGTSDHEEDDCTEKNHYFKKNGDNCKEQVQLKDVCPSLEEDIRKLESQNYKCNFCGDSDHSEYECEEKLQTEYISKYCHYCDEYGHFEDTCPLVEQAASEMENQRFCKASSQSSNKVSFFNDYTTLTKSLVDLKICQICEEFGHNEDNCFVQQQQEFYNKYCDRCKENGHYEKDCALNKQSSSNSSNNCLKKEVEFQRTYTSICSDHCVCENCHNVYCEEQNSSKWEKSKNSRKTTSKSEENAVRVRFCTLCGKKGLIDTCFLKERATK